MPTPAHPVSQGEHGRFDLLLPLRGLLALAVVLHHITTLDVGIRSARVVMFFVISGYCILASAESAMLGSRSPVGWLGRRVLRIWPAYALALAYLGAMLALGVRASRVVRTDQSPFEWALNAALLAWTHLIAHPTHAAWRNPELAVPMHWTLGYEVQFYALVAATLALTAAGGRRLGWIAGGLAAIGVIAAMVQNGTQRGLLSDYALCLAAGAAVFYRGHISSVARRRLIDLGLVATLAAGLGVIGWKFSEISASPRSSAVEISIAAAFALGLIVVRPIDAAIGRLRGIGVLRFLGRISYSLFLVHPINMPMVAALAGRALPSGAPRVVEVAVQLGFHVALAVPFWWLCERPFAHKLFLAPTTGPAASGRDGRCDLPASAPSAASAML